MLIKGVDKGLCNGVVFGWCHMLVVHIRHAFNLLLKLNATWDALSTFMRSVARDVFVENSLVGCMGQPNRGGIGQLESVG